LIVYFTRFFFFNIRSYIPFNSFLKFPVGRNSFLPFSSSFTHFYLSCIFILFFCYLIHLCFIRKSFTFSHAKRTQFSSSSILLPYPKICGSYRKFRSEIPQTLYTKPDLISSWTNSFSQNSILLLFLDSSSDNYICIPSFEHTLPTFT
jgi:hypothetical protein